MPSHGSDPQLPVPIPALQKCYMRYSEIPSYSYRYPYLDDTLSLRKFCVHHLGRCNPCEWLVAIGLHGSGNWPTNTPHIVLLYDSKNETMASVSRQFEFQLHSNLVPWWLGPVSTKRRHQMPSSLEGILHWMVCHISGTVHSRPRASRGKISR
jgi:hypothetical protein